MKPVMRDARWIELFERYRTRGDVQALAELFDELAPTLLKLARHLDGRHGEAEDVVQTTFLVAIERASTYDASRPLVPWLMGILVNQARIARRKRRESSDDGGSERLASPVDGDDAESREVAAEVAKALEALPETYREVVIAHVQRGQKPREIAKELGRPAGTVRAQLHRGLRLVRRMLPAGLSIGLLAASAPRSLASVRRTVLLDAARRAGNDAPLPRAQPGLVLPILAAAVVLLVLGLWWWSTQEGPRNGVDPTIAGATPRSERPSADDPAPLERDTSPDTRVVVVPTLASVGETPTRGRVEVRVARSDGSAEPVDGVLVTLIPWGEERWFDHVDERRTDAHGLAVFEHVAPGRIGLHAEHGEQERVDVVAAHTTRVDLAWHASAALRGRVVDARGYAVPGAQVELWHPDGTPAARGGVQADGDGEFELPRVDAMLAVGARDAAHAPSTLAWLGSPLHEESPRELVLVLRDPAPHIRGRVHDDQDAPIAGAIVRASSPSQGLLLWRDDGATVLEAPPRAVVSDEHGVFDLGALAPGRLELEVEAAGFARWTSSSAGERDLELDVALSRGGRLRATFTTPDGAPLANAQLHRFERGFERGFERAGARDSELLGVSDASGRLDVVLAAGGYELRARDGRFGAWNTARVSITDGADTTWECALEPPRVISGVATLVDGRPLLRGLVCSITEDAPARDAWGPWSRPGGVSDEVVHSWTSTDGSFRVPCRGGGLQTIEVRRRSHWLGVAAGRVLHVAPGTSGLRIAVGQRDAHVRGRLVDARGEVVSGAEIVAFPLDGGGEAHARVDATTGGFELGPLLADEHRLVALVPGRGPTFVGRAQAKSGARIDVGVLSVPASGSIELVGEGPFVLRGTDGLHRATARTRSGSWTSGPIPCGAYRVLRGAIDLDVEALANERETNVVRVAR